MRRRLTTSTVKSVHPYTRSRAPWRIDTCEGDQRMGKSKFGRKLFHYISGGGMKSFGRTVQEEEANTRRTRFLIEAALFGLAWLFFLLFA